MNSESNKRSSDRRPNAAFVVLIDAPSHSDVLLEPMDVSLGGFKVQFQEKPEMGEVINCSIDIMNKVFDGCRMTVARVEKNDTDPPTWVVGISLEVPENLRSEYEASLKETFPDVGREAEFPG
ncbi:PilZ domain-containing protein [Nitrospinota bacterium]